MILNKVSDAINLFKAQADYIMKTSTFNSITKTNPTALANAMRPNTMDALQQINPVKDCTCFTQIVSTTETHKVDGSELNKIKTHDINITSSEQKYPELMQR